MKIRMGFVSNSSTSSFCIYGTTIDKDVMRKMFSKKDVSNDDDDYDDDDDEDYELLPDKIASKCEHLGLEYHSPYGWDCCFIGKSWSEIGDDETGKQFKVKIENILEQFFDKKVNCETFEESYSS